MILYVVIALICILAGMRVFFEQEQTRIFNKRKLPLENVKRYNHACGILVWCFGAAADVVCYLCLTSEGLWSNLLPLYVLAEAVILMKIYFEVEKKSIKKNV